MSAKVPFQTLTRSASRRLATGTNPSSPTSTAEAPTTPSSMASVAPVAPMVSVTQAALVAPVAPMVPVTQAALVAPVAPMAPVTQAALVVPVAPMAPVTQAALKAPVAVMTQPQYPARAASHRTAGHIPSPYAASAVASTTPYSAAPAARSASGCSQFLTPQPISEPWKQAKRPATPSNALNTPGDRRRRGANAFLDNTPAPVEKLPGDASDLQDVGSPPLFIDPFGPTAEEAGLWRETSVPISPRTVPLQDVEMEEPLPNENTAADLMDYINEESERYVPSPPHVPPRLGLHNIRPNFQIERCTSPTCPVPRSQPHERGLFMHGGIINPRSQGDEEINALFGASNPPPSVWDAVGRKRAGRGRPGDTQSIESFARHHNFILMKRSDLQLDVDGDGMVDFGDGTPVFVPLELGEVPYFPLLWLPEDGSPN